jgi:hypothetical protein
MKPLLFALVSLVLGVAIGWVSTRSEFARDVLPVTRDEAANPGADLRTGPRAVVVNGERFDFGTMDRFARDKHTFKIRNDGNAPLELALGNTTCKCTVGSLNSSRLPPGEGTDVTLEWQVKTGDFRFEQSAELLTNDPHHNPIRLIIHGTVIDTLRPEEPQITLSDLSANEESEVRMAVFAFRVNDLAAVSYRWLKPDNADRLKVSFEPLPPEKLPPGGTSGVTIVLKVLPGLPLGPLAETLQITFNVPEYDPLDVPVYGSVVSDVSLAGPGVNAARLLVNLGQAPASEGLKRTAYIVVKGRHRGDTQVQLVGTEPSAEFQATLGEPMRDNPALVRFPLTIEIPPNATPVARTGDENFARVKLTTTHPQVKEMTVKLRYIIKE